MIEIEGTKLVKDRLKEITVNSKNSTKRLKPNITLNLTTVSVVPRRTSWSDMEGFKAKKYGPFVFCFRNINNDIVGGVTLYISYNCQGQFEAKGKYLSEVMVLPKDIFAKPGYDLICNVTASKPINYGTMDNPIAGIALKVQIQMKSYHKLKPYSSSSLNNPEEVVFPSLTGAVESIKPETSSSTDRIAKGLNPKVVFSAKQYPERSVSTTNIVHRFISKINSEEQYLNVIVRGDGDAVLICGSGY